MEIPVIRNVLEANEKLSARLKEHFARHGILTLNLISSPGAGKTSRLERTLADLSPRVPHGRYRRRSPKRTTTPNV